jgi:hypothetical protein
LGTIIFIITGCGYKSSGIGGTGVAITVKWDHSEKYYSYLPPAVSVSLMASCQDGDIRITKRSLERY